MNGHSSLRDLFLKADHVTNFEMLFQTFPVALNSKLLKFHFSNFSSKICCLSVVLRRTQADFDHFKL